MAADDPTFPAIGISRGGTAAVLAQIGPSLYRANAFRLIGLPVEASAQDVRRRAEALRMSESIGAAPPPGFEPLPPTERPSADEVREALQRVQDPETRVVEELFWFWPMNPGESRIDRALAATAAGDFATACGLWRNTPAGGVGLHNLAVLSHAVALDHEAGETRQALDLVDEDRDYLQRLWRQTHLDWTAVLDEPAFWQRFADRIREVEVSDRRAVVE